MKKHIVTVGRQFGSDGADIAKRLSALLGTEYFDKEILVKASESSGISRDAFERADERATSSFLYSITMSSYSGNISPLGVNDVMMSDRLFGIQAEEIRKIASKSNCVFVGRCADDILSSFDELIRIFIHAPVETRIARVMERHKLNESSARTLIKKTDKKRSSYYSFYTGKDWGLSENYDITINSSSLGQEKTALLLRDFVLSKNN